MAEEPKDKSCPACGGTGVVANKPAGRFAKKADSTCPNCKGTGRVPKAAS